MEIEWSRLHGDRPLRRISLPTYPFARERHWFVSGKSKHATDFHNRSDVLHPLLQRNTSILAQQSYSSVFSGDECFLFETSIADDNNSDLESARASKCISPMALLEMARAAMVHAAVEEPGFTIVEFYGVKWSKELQLLGTKEVSIALFEEESLDDVPGQICYEIFSVLDDVQGDSKDRLHCEGSAQFSSVLTPLEVDIQELASSMMEIEADQMTLLDDFRGDGGGRWKLNEVFRDLDQWLLSITLSDEQPDDPRYGMHPSIMDGAILTAMKLAGLHAPGHAYGVLPSGLDKLRVIRPMGRQMYAWVRRPVGLPSGQQSSGLDIDFIDANGAVCAQIEGLHVDHADSSPATSSLIAIPEWQSLPTGEGVRPLLEHHVLLCGESNFKTDQIETLIPGVRCEKVEVGSGNIAARYSECAARCFEYLQRLMKEEPDGRILVQLLVAESEENRIFAALSAMLRTVALEGKVSGQVLLVRPTAEESEVAAQLQDAMSSQYTGLIRFEKDGKGYIPAWKAVGINPDSAPVPFKDKGVYVVTGGLGGLGRIFVREILQTTAHSQVFVTGRSELTAEKNVLLQELSSDSNQVTYQQVDLSSPRQVKDFITDVARKHGQINGILHSAGMLADGSMIRKSMDEFHSVLEPKVTGTFNLDEACQEIDLDFFVTFSSISAVMGNAGQIDYAAANAFMDQFAHYRTCLTAAGKRRGRTMSINWPLWNDGGMRVPEIVEQMIKASTGLHVLQTAEGLAAFRQSLSLDANQALVLQGESDRLGTLLDQLGKGFQFGGSSGASPGKQMPSPRRDQAKSKDSVDSAIALEDLEKLKQLIRLDLKIADKDIADA